MANVLYESMNDRQRKFVSRVVSRQTPENRSLLETVVKAYVITEGIGGFARRARRKAAVASKRMANSLVGDSTRIEMPSVPASKPPSDYVALAKARMFEDDSWEADYAKFLENCEAIKYFIDKFGEYELNTLTNTPAFKEALSFGKELDQTRVNPLKKIKENSKAMHECLDMLYWGDNRQLLESIYLDLSESMSVEIGNHPIFEARDAETTEMFKDALAGVAEFIRRHGAYPWTEWLKENHLAERSQKPAAATGK